MKFAVIGGDMRQARMAEMLASDGHYVTVSLMEETEIPGAENMDWQSAIKNTEYIVLPLPVSSSGGAVNAPMSKEHETIYNILESIRPSQTVLAGMVDMDVRHFADGHGIRIIDYFQREELAVTNAAATAEGAIQILMEELPVTLLGSKLLVVGFGRIGKILAMRLKALGADITASARNFADFAWIKALGYDAADTRRLDGNLKEYDAVINTVPSRIFTEKLLKQIKAECLCLDLASKPGGIDFEAASRLGIHAVWALSLPGKVAPVTSGMAIKNTIYNIISELECTD